MDAPAVASVGHETGSAVKTPAAGRVKQCMPTRSLHRGGETLWFYNATNLVHCINVERSEKRCSGAIAMEAFAGYISDLSGRARGHVECAARRAVEPGRRLLRIASTNRPTPRVVDARA